MNEAATFTRFAAVYSSRETDDPAVSASRHVRWGYEAGLDAHLAPHIRAWEDRWRAAGLEVTGDEPAQQALRFALYHLNSAVNPNDEHVSVGARGLTGSVYKGHVFWDTEIYLLPFYTFTYPAAARALLMYRFHTLPAARDRARSFGYEGALYAWESADTGDDVTPASVVAPNGEVVEVLTGMQEHHISADVAHAVWQYWQATADEPFFLTAGIDILVETARFWATRGRLEQDGRYHIRTVIGPDEYHESVDDNAFTNVMAQWNLERAAEAVEWIRSSRHDAWRTVAERLRIKPDEADAWRRIAGAMVTGFDPRTNLFEQFAGFFRLEDLDLEAYRARTVPIDVILGRERTQRSKVVKQADVIALSAILWERFPYAVHDANFRYYEPRTAHGSSLSPSFHALVSARLGMTALRYFQAAALIVEPYGQCLRGGHAISRRIMADCGLRDGGVRFRTRADPRSISGDLEDTVVSLMRGRAVAVTINRDRRSPWITGRQAIDISWVRKWSDRPTHCFTARVRIDLERVERIEPFTPNIGRKAIREPRKAIHGDGTSLHGCRGIATSDSSRAAVRIGSRDRCAARRSGPCQADTGNDPYGSCLAAAAARRIEP